MGGARGEVAMMCDGMLAEVMARRSHQFHQGQV
jgi:hypothetical protein